MWLQEFVINFVIEIRAFKPSLCVRLPSYMSILTLCEWKSSNRTLYGCFAPLFIEIKVFNDKYIVDPRKGVRCGSDCSAGL